METLKTSEFEKVFLRGKRLSDRLLRIRVFELEDGSVGKLAFVAGKRLGNAVFRNRCKRVLRVAARECGLPAEGYGIILLATSSTHESSPEEVSQALAKLLKRAGVQW